MCEKHLSTEEWKEVILVKKLSKDKKKTVVYEIKEGKYEISNKGKLRSFNNKKRIYTPEKCDDGYTRYTLSYVIKSKKKSIKVLTHQLTGQYFIHNTDETKKVVDHIDQNRSHNCIENLRWITHVGNGLHRTKTSYNRGISIMLFDETKNVEFKTLKDASAFIKNDQKLNVGDRTIQEKIKKSCIDASKIFGYYWKYTNKHDLENEIWKELVYKDKTYIVSNMGRFKRQDLNNEITRGSIVKENVDKKVQQYYNYDNTRAHILVAIAFIGKKPGKDYDVNHKNKTTTDNRAENLEWMTKMENSNYLKAESKTDKTKTRVMLLDPKTEKVIMVYTSLLQAVHNCKTRGIKVSVDTIGLCCSKNEEKGTYKSGGYIWRYAPDVYDEKLECTDVYEKYNEKMCIGQYKDNELQFIYRDVKDVYSINPNFTKGKVVASLNTSRTHMGFKFNAVKIDDIDKEKLLKVARDKLSDTKYETNVMVKCNPINKNIKEDCEYKFDFYVNNEYYVNVISDKYSDDWFDNLTDFYEKLSQMNKDVKFKVWVVNDEKVCKKYTFLNGK